MWQKVFKKISIKQSVEGAGPETCSTMHNVGDTIRIRYQPRLWSSFSCDNNGCKAPVKICPLSNKSVTFQKLCESPQQSKWNNYFVTTVVLKAISALKIFLSADRSCKAGTFQKIQHVYVCRWPYMGSNCIRSRRLWLPKILKKHWKFSNVQALLLWNAQIF